MRKKLTEVYIKSAKPPAAGRLVVADTEVPCLSLRVTTNGARSWLIRYRVRGERGQRNITPGPYPTVTLADARQRARDIIAAAKRGVDLVEHERQQTTRAKATEAQSSTVVIVAEEFIRRDLEGKNRAPSYVAATRRMFKEHIYSRWSARDIRSVTRSELAALLDTIVDDGKPVVANRMLAAVRAMFNWAIRRGIIEASPATLVERPTDEKGRERTLNAEEIHALWPAFDALSYPFGSFFKMVVATGQRRDEVAHMRWADINEKERYWTLSGKMTKAGRAHVVPLSTLAMEILASAKDESKYLVAADVGRTTDRVELRPFVFTTRGDRPISGYSKAKNRLGRAVAAQRMKANLPALEPWTVHDLRRTVATGLGSLGIPRFVISRVLNHADNSITGIYDRHEYLSEKRHALEAWSTHVSNLIA